jgi:phosphoglycolate phosphatase-like HAD superfamily hydrolase
VTHVIWDWNGTLFDDHRVVVDAVNASLDHFGVPPIDSATYRREFVRPLQVFYTRLFGRTIDDATMQEIDDVFQAAYARGFGEAALTADALTAIGLLADAGVSQSIASMLWHDLLVSAVTRFGLADRMLALDGHRGAVGETKEQHLIGHVDRLERMYPGLSRSRITVIGDITDDAVAARAAGVSCVLYDGGSQDRAALEAERFPVADSLVEAARHVIGAITPGR